MFCSNCGTKIEDSNFCHECGNKANNKINSSKKNKNNKTKISSNIDETKELSEDYLGKTNIKNKDDAKKRLDKLRLIFLSIFLGYVVLIISFDSSLYSILVAMYLGFWLYLIMFCLKLLEDENISKANVLWFVFFAPLSWIFLYRLMARPLKIILGEIQPPPKFTNERRKQQEYKSKKSWSLFWLIVGVTAAMIVLLISVSFLI